MAEQRITPEELAPESIEPEIEANERRNARLHDRDEEHGVVGTVEHVVPPDEAERERQRELNDAEQRG